MLSPILLLSFPPDLPHGVQTPPPLVVTQNDDSEAISPCQTTQTGPFPLNLSQSLTFVSHTPRWQSPPQRCPSVSYIWFCEAVLKVCQAGIFTALQMCENAKEQVIGYSAQS